MGWEILEEIWKFSQGEIMGWLLAISLIFFAGVFLWSFYLWVLEKVALTFPKWKGLYRWIIKKI
ncbi:MAG: hypothetical protein PHC68_00515 [Syntrophorhabdaceae bacterium]|nr:hypothetical protein [Syntrophorhabdaceae bacterium]